VALDHRSWPWICFKGGSNPGVLAFCWLAEHANGRRFVLVEQQNSLDPLLVRDTRPLLGGAGQAIGSLLVPDGGGEPR
jgi:hypothetical protein